MSLEVLGVITARGGSKSVPRKNIREVAGKPTELWMVGDNPQADVIGAEQVGIPVILVRRPPGPDVLRSAVDLVGAAAHILAE